MEETVSAIELQANQQVHDFWNKVSCGEELYLLDITCEAYERQAEQRYQLEPYIEAFAGFAKAAGLRTLEIGLGLGADHERFASAGANLSGVELTERSVAHSRRRLAMRGLISDIALGDAEKLPFPDCEFDLVYSWGVLHHSSDPQRCIAEVHRVLKPGGEARIMIYHKWSMVGMMLYLRYGLLMLRPWRSLRFLYANFLESPGTKAYSVSEAKTMFASFSEVKIQTVLSHGDLLSSQAGQRHEGLLLNLARAIWPRWLIKTILPRAGLFMLILARV